MPPGLGQGEEASTQLDQPARLPPAVERGVHADCRLARKEAHHLEVEPGPVAEKPHRFIEFHQLYYTLLFSNVNVFRAKKENKMWVDPNFRP
ncbi:MAG: hypothetical protein Q8O19_02610 [Rectinemataceae bacterium]|nr:hypothetical protein [Rectinemataceae bacterium]